MDTRHLYELVGYVASGLVALSLMMSSLLRLRVINLFGSAAFAIYGVAIGAYPVAVVNTFIVGINLYYLRQMLGAREYFRLLTVRHDSEYLHYFLSYYGADIVRFLPDVSLVPREEQLIVFVLRDLVPAGLFVGEARGSTLHVELDFVIPQYRDLQVGRYLFAQRALFAARGITELVSAPGTAEHQAYLRRMGFVPAGDVFRMTV